ncbi:hypothetical protein K470DRAFT_240831 [Piedraia hortae CBS 480.64]|uniref:DUF7918 domain-containing protein n=1 Tax=Piedraia hortae CBS 480.64 TaxID=1314780 RepID=A0A6A7C8Y3_9PEZI|nr:hypothetical protein K470DRAFT_240831 [Piedraia hortae CBS 480.64]
MPCFKGLSINIHTADGPLPELALQRHSRSSRVSAYIPVPPAKLRPDSVSGKPEQSTFAISITLLTPGLKIPNSAPEPTPENPDPQPRVVGALASDGQRNADPIAPYIPSTNHPNETLAAYIYFDGRPKEEVATLLRRGEETWVNSRWVKSDNGGLAEREFLFREIGLERYLNGLDLTGRKNNGEKSQARQKRLSRQAQREQSRRSAWSDNKTPDSPPVKKKDEGGDDSDAEEAEPEAAGQIKVILFRVLASGEVRHGEYLPQFSANEDDDQSNTNDDDVDHTTSFAKPRSLDPSSISTQTVTGIDTPGLPYATFTFFYRGERQLRKMGILPSSPEKNGVANGKHRSTDFSKLGPLTSFGTVGFSGYRDPADKKSKKGGNDGADSDAEDDEEADEEKRLRLGKDVEDASKLLSPEDAKEQGELAEGVEKIRLKRQRSVDPLTDLARKTQRADD